MPIRLNWNLNRRLEFRPSVRTRKLLSCVMLLRILILYLSFNAGFVVGCYWAGSRHRVQTSGAQRNLATE